MAFGLNTGSVSGGLTQLLISFCQQEGLQMPAICLKYERSERIPFLVWQQTLADIYRQYQKEGMGLQIARLSKPAHVGVLGYLGAACDTVGEAFSRFDHYHRLAYDGNDMQISMEYGQIEISWGTALGKPGQLVDETAIGLFVHLVRQLISPSATPLSRIRFVNPKPKNTMIYQQFFGCPVEFNAERTAVVFPLELLHIRLHDADFMLKRLLQSQADSLLNHLPSPNQFSLNLQQHIVNAVQSGNASIENIAEKMGMSVRGLQRELKTQGDSFQQKLADVREQLAKEYLQDQTLSLTDIALLLGYSEQSAFQRAFKQWTQQTPLQWRQFRLEQATQTTG
jgi:AraC-like DNA-binding protein